MRFFLYAEKSLIPFPGMASERVGLQVMPEGERLYAAMILDFDAGQIEGIRMVATQPDSGVAVLPS